MEYRRIYKRERQFNDFDLISLIHHARERDVRVKAYVPQYLDSGYIDAGSTVASVMVGGENGPAEPSTGMSATLATTRAAPSLCSSYAMRPRSSKATPCAALLAPSTKLPTQPYGAREELPPVSRADPALPPRLGLGYGGVPQGEEAREKDKNWMVRGFVGDGGVAGGDVWHIGFLKDRCLLGA